MRVSNTDDWPSYYSDDSFADSLDEAQRKYITSPKGKAALKRYAQSDKGKENFRRYYQKKKKEGQVVEFFLKWQKDNPTKSLEDFLKGISE